MDEAYSHGIHTPWRRTPVDPGGIVPVFFDGVSVFRGELERDAATKPPLAASVFLFSIGIGEREAKHGRASNRIRVEALQKKAMLRTVHSRQLDTANNNFPVM